LSGSILLTNKLSFIHAQLPLHLLGLGRMLRRSRN
jgi:hypothetical protein